MESFYRPALKAAFVIDPKLDCKEFADEISQIFREQGKPFHLDKMHFKLLSVCQAEKLLSTTNFHKHELDTVKDTLGTYHQDCADFQSYLKQHTLLRRPQLLQYAEAECNTKKYSDEELFILQ